jgi:hypothetical protein
LTRNVSLEGLYEEQSAHTVELLYGAVNRCSPFVGEYRQRIDHVGMVALASGLALPA